MICFRFLATNQRDPETTGVLCNEKQENEIRPHKGNIPIYSNFENTSSNFESSRYYC